MGEKMEESGDILLNSLANSGVPIPPGVLSVRDLTATTLVSVCSHALHLIDARLFDEQAVLPEDSTAERFQICSDLGSTFKDLGFVGDLSFDKFLYPSEDDVFKLVRFLVEKLSESSKEPKSQTGGHDRIGSKLNDRIDKGEPLQNDEAALALKDLKLSAEVTESANINTESSLAQESNKPCSALENGEEVNANFKAAGAIKQDCDRGELTTGNHRRDMLQGVQESKPNAVRDETSIYQNLEEELDLLKTAIGIVLDDQHPIEFHLEKLTNQVKEKGNKLLQREVDWNATKRSLEEEKNNLEQALSVANPEACEKLRRLTETRSETILILSEIKRREEEISQLSAVLEKQPNLASRKSYVQRIKEITKNSRKLDIDIQRILKDTRELQLESNSIQERLSRTYAVVDETVFREAKKDATSRQAYRLLTRIHESFEDIGEKILLTDRTRREVADYEAKIATTSSKSLNIEKLQADLDAIRKENDLLEQRLKKKQNL